MIVSQHCAVADGAPGLLVFDCDGVLIDSEAMVCRLTSEELTCYGYAITAEEVMDRFAGRPEREMIQEVEQHWGETIPAAFFPRLRSRVEQAYGSELRVMPGVVEVLERLTVPYCVASSSYPSKLELGLCSTGLFDRFAPNIISASAVARGKPAPDVFVFAAGWMRTPVGCCLVIEDSTAGVASAVAAGMRVFGFAGGSHCRVGHAERLLQAGAERVFHEFRELPAMLPSAFAPKLAESAISGNSPILARVGL